MRTFCEEKAQERQMLPWQQWMEYSFPCDLEPCCSPPGCERVKLKNTKIFINVKFEACHVSGSESYLLQTDGTGVGGGRSPTKSTRSLTVETSSF